MKIKVGIFFGGDSKEREISFAGGRTVYDNLNKSIFEAIPIFVDSFKNFVLLDWQYIYKGSIRDFYPPVDFIKSDTNDFQIYAENIDALSSTGQEKLITKIGKKLAVEEFKELMDVAFLCLHGTNGEDGKLQGLFEYYNIPYTGSGILSSSIGINKSIQKQLMVSKGFNSPLFETINRQEYYTHGAKNTYQKIKNKIHFPCVVKPANQGSSIAVTILQKDNYQDFCEALEKAFFIRRIKAIEWNAFSEQQKIDYVRVLADIREGISLPVKVENVIIYHPSALIDFINKSLVTNTEIVLEALDAETEVLVEGFIEGKEFSCIVIQNTDGKPVALPPTEIRKGKELFDYRSKYLPGLSRKITPIDIPTNDINAIRKECERLFTELYFDVYARIDGFIDKIGKVYLNDPNTTSGMMPSSFFFHQAAEIGLNPSQFLTYIIRTSIAQRIAKSSSSYIYVNLLNKLDKSIESDQKQVSQKIKVAVLLGGYSSERHISVESGRNIYEKLSSSIKYEPLPIFLTGNEKSHELFQIPINVLLKDNADDIKEKVNSYKTHPVVEEIINQVKPIIEKYATKQALLPPQKISYDDLKKKVNAVFIALHGRPGEDGEVQKKLDLLQIPYNGSGVESSQTTIDKYTTNEILKQNGLLIAEHMLVKEDEWNANPDKIFTEINNKISLPFIAKPVDDGCSSAVRKIKTKEEFFAFTKLIFRKSEPLDASSAELLKIKPKEEFPIKKVILIEELISKKDANHFLEVTGGMLTKINSKGELEYEVFEASEALSEGEVLSLEEKFLAGQGQNITPARYSTNEKDRQVISNKVKEVLGKAAKILNVVGYCRIDAFVRIYNTNKVEVIFVEVNSLPGMTPATCIFHQTAINGYKPYDFIDKILQFGMQSKQKAVSLS